MLYNLQNKCTIAICTREGPLPTAHCRLAEPQARSLQCAAHSSKPKSVGRCVEASFTCAPSLAPCGTTAKLLKRLPLQHRQLKNLATLLHYVHQVAGVVPQARQRYVLAFCCASMHAAAAAAAAVALITTASNDDDDFYALPNGTSSMILCTINQWYHH